MFRIISNVLSSDEVLAAREELEHASFQDGKATAQGHAKQIKNNQQLPMNQDRELANRLMQSIAKNSSFQAFALPRKIRPLTISKYTEGMDYGSHVDLPFMGDMRTDLSFTLFLSEADSYEGGELILETELGERKVKLPAGSMVLYPSTRLHRVAPVRAGIRFAAVSWVQSLIGEEEKREICIEIEQVRSALKREHGWDDSIAKLTKATYNLKRLWGET